MPSAPEPGSQDVQSPAKRYRAAIVSLDKHCQTSLGKHFFQRDKQQQDAIITLLEAGKVNIGGSSQSAPTTRPKYSNRG